MTRADVVVLGHVLKYERVLDQAVRARRREQLARATDMPADMRESLANQTNFTTDYARFTLRVDKVLAGKASKTLTATWDNSSFPEPDALPSGQLFVALRNPQGSPTNDLSTAITSGPDAGRLTLLQANCAPAFIFKSDSAEARQTQDILLAGGH